MSQTAGNLMAQFLRSPKPASQHQDWQEGQQWLPGTEAQSDDPLGWCRPHRRAEVPSLSAPDLTQVGMGSPEHQFVCLP